MARDEVRQPWVDRAQPRFAPVYDLLEQAIIDGVFPGCAFGVRDEHGDVVRGAVGRQTYAADSPLITPDTVYDLASVTKVVATTAMAMLLYQRKLLDLDAPIVRWTPAFFQHEPQRAAVTIRHLLAHSSGLAGYAKLYETYSTPDAIVQACAAMPLEAAPGTRAEYSDIGFILLGRILEIIADESIDSFCRREIFDPLGMENTCFQPRSDLKRSIPPTENDRVFRHRILQGEVQDENCFVLGGVSGHAGLFSNVGDILRFAEAILRPGPDRLYLDKTVEVFSTRTNLPPGSSRALGWDTPSQPSSSGTMFSTRSVGHLGYAGTSVWIDCGAPHSKPCAVVLLTNRTWPTRENQKIKQLRPAFHDAVRGCLLGTSTS